MSTNHQRWDGGQLAELSAFIGQKSVKTACNKRVKLAEADHSKVVNCFGCRETINSRKEFILEEAVRLNDQNILRTLADRTLQHATQHRQRPSQPVTT